MRKTTLRKMLTGLAFISMVAFLSFVALAGWPASQAQAVGGPAEQIPLADAADPDPPNRVTRLVLENGQVVDSSVMELAVQEFSAKDLPEPLSEEKRSALQNLPKEPEPEKIHPLLAARLAQLGGEGLPDEPVEVIVSFRDHLKVPRFPSPNTAEPRDSAYNSSVMARNEQLVEAISAARADGYQKLAAELSAGYGCKVKETFWLINGVSADMPLSAVEALAAREDLLYIEPRHSGEPPPQDSNDDNDAQDGRARIGTDAYFNVGFPLNSSGYIGLLDTGVRFTHTLFTNPSNIGFKRDCVNGGANCNATSNPGYDTTDNCWNHGTKSAAIISGNDNLDNAFRGVTAITLDSFKVYSDGTPCGGTGGLDTEAAVRGFEAAVLASDRVIVAEMQGGGGEDGAISQAADAAFDAGAVIIAANGNASQVSAVGAPAAAHKVIGVGAVDVETLETVSQINGPAPDGRIKPDIQAPTGTETASSMSDTAITTFTGTSGATPYAAGAAALLRNWLRGSSFDIDPGQVYAHLIASGQTVNFSNSNGAGLINVPTNGVSFFGNVTVGDDGVMTASLPIGTGYTRIDAAIWWPESPDQQHNDIDLSLYDPNGVKKVSSTSIPSVFERLRHSGTLAAGTWTLRIRGYNVPDGPQKVYFSAHMRR